MQSRYTYAILQQQGLRLQQCWRENGRGRLARLAVTVRCFTSSCITHSSAHSSSAAVSHSLHPPPSTPARHILIYGGGSMGIFHAGLFQLKATEERRRKVKGLESSNVLESATSSVPSTATRTDVALDHSTVHLISRQRDLIELIHSKGFTLELLQAFVRANSPWIFPEGQTPTPHELELLLAGKSHFTLPKQIRLAASCSSMTCTTLQLQPPTHILVMVKGRKAIERVTDEIYDLYRNQVQLNQPLPIICVVMNGLGHQEVMLDQVRELLKKESNPSLSPDQQLNFLALFNSQLYVATTTSGAKLCKTYSTYLNPEGRILNRLPVRSLHLRHGGMGITTVIQNEADARRIRRRPQAITPPRALEDTLYDPTLPPPIEPAITSLDQSSACPLKEDGSCSLVSLFRWIGLETHLAPYEMSQSILSTKLLINCAINPLTALHHIPNGTLKQDQFTQIIVGLTKEFLKVTERLGIPIAAYPPDHDLTNWHELSIWPDNISAFVPINLKPDVDTTADDFHRALFHIYSTIDRTKSNYSSMVQDLHPDTELVVENVVNEVRRPRTTEIDSITGWILKQAETLGLNVQNELPINRDLYERVKFAERIYDPNSASIASSKSQN